MMILRDEPARRFIHGMNLRCEGLWTVANRADSAAAQATKNHRRNAAGTFADQEAVAAIREQFGTEGWQLFEKEGVEGIFDPIKRVAVITQNALYAEREDRTPRASRTKGPGSSRIVDASQPYIPGLAPKKSGMILDGISVFYLLISRLNRSIFLELSQPSEMQNGNFVDFATRVFVPKLDNGGQRPPEKNERAPTTKRKIKIGRR